MKKIALKIWKDPVWSKVIASGLLVVFGSLCLWFLDLWPKVYKVLSTVWGLIIYEVSVPLWLIVLLVPMLILSVPLLRRLIPDQDPGFLKYRRDNILGIIWSWDWSQPGVMKIRPKIILMLFKNVL